MFDMDVVKISTLKYYITAVMCIRQQFHDLTYPNLTLKNISAQYSSEHTVCASNALTKYTYCFTVLV